jgi:tRNA dimethylallyltransferase
MSSSSPIVAVLAGPTASGKTALALRWAAARNLEIISVDSRQLYEGFRVGTGSPGEEEMQGIPHHLLGSVPPSEAFSPRRFALEAEKIVSANPGKRFLVVGGTGLYLKEWMHPGSEDRGETPKEIREAAAARIAEIGLEAAHIEMTGKDPEGMRRVDPHDIYRVTKRLENWLKTGRSYALPKVEEPLNPLFAGVPFLWLHRERKVLHDRIATRAEEMFRRGWADEVRALTTRFDPMRAPAFNAIGYREIAAALAAGKPPESMLPTVVARTRQYAKKQMTFLRHQFPGAVAWEPSALEAALEEAGWDVEQLPEGVPP